MTWKERMHLILMNKNEPRNNDILEEKTNTEEEIPTPQKAKEPLKNSAIFTSFLILILAITGLGYLSYLTGHGLNVAEMVDQTSEEIFLFIFMGISIVLLGVKMDIISWGTIRFLSTISIVLIFIHLIGASIWPNWNPRNWAQEITNPKTEISTQRKETKKQKEVITFTQAAHLTFHLKPYQKTKQKFFAIKGLTSHISTPPGHDFFIIYEDGESVHIQGHKKFPERPGVYSVMNGSKPSVLEIIVLEN